MRDPGLRGIAALLRLNRDFRRLWLAQVVSQAGDWFHHVAVMTLLLELTGSGRAVAGSLVLRMLPWFFVAPVAGVVIDRVDRKKVLLVSDLLRGLLVPAFLLVRDPSLVPLVYVLIAAQVTIGAFFEPARQAVLPAIVAREQLLSANALMALTWSLMLAVGSALGGVVIHFFGLRLAFVVDAASFFLSATFVLGVAVPARAAAPPAQGTLLRRGFADLLEGLRYLRRDRGVLSLALVKCGVGLAGGMMLVLTVFGERVFPIGETAAAGMGVLFLARGLGTAVGPFVGRAISGYAEPAMRRLIGVGFLQAALFYLLFARAEELVAAALLLAVAHFGTSVNWVFSTVLLQLKVPDGLRGRVFAAEFALFTVVFCVAVQATGFALDVLAWSPRLLAAVSGGSLALPGIVWIAVHARRARRHAA